MNLIKTNEVTKNLLSNLKVIYENNIIEVINYKKILSFTNDEIILLNLIIKGENLKVIYIDKYSIKVNGKIHLIKGDKEYEDI